MLLKDGIILGVLGTGTPRDFDIFGNALDRLMLGHMLRIWLLFWAFQQFGQFLMMFFK